MSHGSTASTSLTLNHNHAARFMKRRLFSRQTEFSPPVLRDQAGGRFEMAGAWYTFHGLSSREGDDSHV